jgi:hypothetical protein
MEDRMTVTGCRTGAIVAFVGVLGAAPAFPSPSSLPATTVIPVTFETTASSATSRPEEKVLARVRQDVVRAGQVVIPAGSELRGHVISARPSGRVKGRASLSLAFTAITVNGRTQPIAARRIALLAPATHGRDAKVIGGGAGAGALVGAIADGGKGAAKGALVGAGAGTGVVLATKGREVTIPAGSRWRVRLLRPLVLD